MNLLEAARFLGVPKATLQRWVRQGVLAGAAPDENEFNAERLRAWAESRGIRPVALRPAAPGPEENLLSGAVARGAVTVGRGVASAAAAVALAVDAIPSLAPEAKSLLREAVLDRERMGSTGIGKGVALPHPRTPPSLHIRDPIVSVVYCEPPVDWAAPDGEPVHSLLVLLPPDAKAHAELLIRASLAMRSDGFLALLRAHPGQAALVERLRLIRRGR